MAEVVQVMRSDGLQAGPTRPEDRPSQVRRPGVRDDGRGRPRYAPPDGRRGRAVVLQPRLPRPLRSLRRRVRHRCHPGGRRLPTPGHTQAAPRLRRHHPARRVDRAGPTLPVGPARGGARCLGGGDPGAGRLERDGRGREPLVRRRLLVVDQGRPRSCGPACRGDRPAARRSARGGPLRRPAPGRRGVRIDPRRLPLRRRPRPSLLDPSPPL